jgi:UDP-glucose 4-epimerase
VELEHTVHLVDSLARGRHDRFLADLLTSDRVDLGKRDLLQPNALDDLGTDYTEIIHLAAILGVQNVLEHPYPTLRDNVQLLANALEFARRQQGLRRFLFASTSEVYAGSLAHGSLPIPTPEAATLVLPALDQPRASYMLSKIYGEAMVRHAGIPFTIVRPHNVYGPRMGRSHVIPELLERAHRARDGDRLEVFSVDHRRTFCFIDDAVEMMAGALLSPRCEGQALNVGSQSPEVTIGELAETVLRVVGRRLAIQPMPATAGSPVRRCPDMSRMAELVGARAQIDLEAGIRRTYDWYRRMVFEGGETEVAL